MARKRHRDLRDFWPWYERQTVVRPDYHSVERPPFDLSEISTPDTVSSVGRRWLPGLTIAAAILLLVYLAWALFH
jgi:hypothetical protein